MNRKQFTTLLILLVILGGAGWLLHKKNDTSWQATDAGLGQKLLGNNFAINDVAEISIKQGTNAVDLVKKDDVWQVRERDGYAANFTEISDFLIKARDLKIVQSEEVGSSALPRLELAASGQGTNSGTLLDLKNKDGKAIKSLVLGKKHTRKPQGSQAAMFGEDGFPDGRYVMLAGDSHDALLVADALSSLEPKPEAWLNKDFFRVEKPRVISVAFPTVTNSWKLSRDSETNEWKLAGAKPEEKLDTSKTYGVANPFSSPSFNDVLPVNSKPEENGLDKFTTVTVETFDGFTYNVKIGKKSGENYPIAMTVGANFPKERVPGKDEKPEQKDTLDKVFNENEKKLEDKLKQEKAFEKWTYLVPTWTVDPILKDRKDLLVEKKDETKTAAAEKTEIAPPEQKP